MRARQIAHRLAGVVLAFGLGAALAGCGSSGSSGTGAGASAPSSASAPASGGSSPSEASAGSGGTGSASPAKLVIKIKDFGYRGPQTVPPGATVTVTNEDDVVHTVTSDTAGIFDVAVNGGETVTFTAPSKPGSYAYHCKYHANMHGTLKVG